MAFNFTLPPGIKGKKEDTPKAGAGADDSDVTSRGDSDDPAETDEMGEDEEKGNAALGSAFAAALKSGDGNSIYEAFERMSRACK